MIATKAVILSVDKETARKQIVDHIERVQTNREDDRIVIKSPTGSTLAYLSDYKLSSGDIGTKLEYRTGPQVPVVLSPLTSKANRIRDVLSRYEV